MSIQEQYEEYIYLSKYARWLPDKNRREIWGETVDRLISFLSTKVNGDLKEVLHTDIAQAIFRKDIMPSMRLMMCAGKAAERCNSVAYNCAGVAVNNPRVFDEIFYILMGGSGVGFSVERQYTNQMPTIAEVHYETDTVIKVKDSRPGWAKAFKELIALLYNGDVPNWDTSGVRAVGERLKTMGGRASGPEPLVKLFKYTIRLFKRAAGRRLSSLECHDLICTIADTVIVGSVRRSACISFSNLTDDRMRRAKSGQWWIENPERALSNNSIMFTEKPDLESYTKEFRSIYKSKSGERGIVNQEALKDKVGDNDYEGEYLLNPCFHPETLIETVHGQVAIKDITDGTMVYSMDKAGKLCIRKASASWITREKAETICIEFNNGKSLIVTPEHKIFKPRPSRGKYKGNHSWVKAKDLFPGDKLNGLYRVRRGLKYSGIKLATDDDYQMEHRLVYEGVNGPLQPEYDVHHVDEDTYNNDASNLEGLHHSTHATLTRYSCDNNHQVKGEGGKFISTGASKREVIPLPNHLKTNVGNQGIRVTAIHPGPTIDVYDIVVEDTHCLVAGGIIAHNCGEAILRESGGFCNLTEVIVRPDDTLDSLKNKVRQATILGTIQASLTSFKYLRKVWTDNAEEERLLGVSLTGIMDHKVMSDITDCVPWVMQLKKLSVRTNGEVAKMMGIKPTRQVTLIKPSGTVSQLTGCSSGIHPRYSKYYQRTIAQDVKDPLSQLMIDQGIPYNIVGEKYYFYFPMKSPTHSILQKDIDAIQQLELWKVYRDYWCDGNPSQTIYYTDDTFLAVQDWVWKNWDSIGGLSFFPISDHIYNNAPYMEINEEKYKSMVSTFPSDVSWDNLSEYELADTTTSGQEFACSGGGSCEL